MDLNNDLESLTRERAKARPVWGQLQRAMNIVGEGFGEFYIDAASGKSGKHDIVRFEVRNCPLSDLIRREDTTRAKLEDIGWLMIGVYLLGDRFKTMGGRPPMSRPNNMYGIVPLQCIALSPRPDVVYHATEISSLTSIWEEGLKPSMRTEYMDAEGKLHVCQKLDGERESAASWTVELSKKRRKEPSDYAILEVVLDAFGGRMYYDLHGEEGLGIVMDHFTAIPPSRIKRVLRG